MCATWTAQLDQPSSGEQGAWEQANEQADGISQFLRHIVKLEQQMSLRGDGSSAWAPAVFLVPVCLPQVVDVLRPPGTPNQHIRLCALYELVC